MRAEGESSRAVATLVEALPEFRPTYEDLLDSYGEDCTPQVVFNALAEDVDEMLLEADANEVILERYFEAVEHVAAVENLDAVEAVAFCFLDALSPDAQRLAQSYLGPATERLADKLAADELSFDELELDDLELGTRELGERSLSELDLDAPDRGLDRPGS